MRPGQRRITPAVWVRRGGLGNVVFALPLLLAFGLFSWWPMARSVVMALQQTNFIVTEWVGLDNFARVLADPVLGKAVWNTVQYTVWSLVIGAPAPILLAVFVAELRRARQIASALAYLPAIVPPVAGMLLWKALYDPAPEGVFNTMLGWVGIDPLAWLNDGHIAIPAIIVLATWEGFGTTTIIYIATLMSVRTELYDAAEVDGASIVGRLWHITLPQMRGTILLMLLLQIIGIFQMFSEPYIMTGGGPNNQTITIMMLIFRYAFTLGDYGRATALSVLLAAALAVLSAVYLRLTRGWSTS
jgi:multiple sugar transport system permease protein